MTGQHGRPLCSLSSSARYYTACILRDLTFLFVVLHFHDVSAQGEPGPVVRELEHVALRLKAAEKAVETRLLSDALRLRYYGYLDGSYTQNFNSPSNRINELRIFDVNSNQFRPNLAQLVLEREAQPTTNWLDRAGFHVKFNAGRDSDFIGGTNLSDWADFQEFYVQYIIPFGSGMDLKLGQINALIGYEVVESPRNPNYSRSWLFGLGQPFTTRGIRASYEFNEHVSWSLGVINRINSNLPNDRGSPWVESAFTLTPSNKVKLTLYSLVGPGLGAVDIRWGGLLLGGGYLSLEVTPQASIVLESYYANQINSSVISQARNARWDGLAGYLIYDLSHQWGVRLRGEIFEDPGGFATCQGTTAYQPRANVCFGATSTTPAPAVGQTLWEFTWTLQFKPVPFLMTRLEYRYDKSDKNVFQVGGRPTSYQPTLSLEAIYLF